MEATESKLKVLKELEPTFLQNAINKELLLANRSKPRTTVFSHDISSAERQWQIVALGLGALTTSKELRDGYIARRETAKRSKDICFLCGFPLNYPNRVSQIKLNAEHILPTGGAFLLFGYPSKGTDIIPFQKIVMPKNYEWAHSYCNSNKKALQFINVFYADKLDDKKIHIFSEIPGNKVNYNEEAIQEFIAKQFRLTRPNPGKTLCPSAMSLGRQIDKLTEEQFRQQAEAAIKAKCAPLVTALNTWNDEYPGDILLQFMTNIALAIENIQKANESTRIRKEFFDSLKVEEMDDLQCLVDVANTADAMKIDSTGLSILADASETATPVIPNTNSTRKRARPYAGFRRKRTRRNKRSIKKRHV